MSTQLRIPVHLSLCTTSDFKATSGHHQPQRPTKAYGFYCTLAVGLCNKLEMSKGSAPIAVDLCRGHETRQWTTSQGELKQSESKRQGLTETFKSAFLPEGYPSSVSQDYLRFQMWDTLQALCSYIRGLLSSQAILKGVGVGKQVNATCVHQCYNGITHACSQHEFRINQHFSTMAPHAIHAAVHADPRGPGLHQQHYTLHTTMHFEMHI